MVKCFKFPPSKLNSFRHSILNILCSKMKTNKVVLLRHGESEFNKKNLFCGWHDSVLTEKGKTQALEIAAANLKKYGMIDFDCVFTSRLKRAKDSVEIIVKALDLVSVPVHYEWRLNERHYGNLTGFNKRDMANKYGEEQVQKWRRKYNVVPPAIEKDNPYFDGIVNNPEFADIPKDDFPLSESMEMALQRTEVLWNKIICPKIISGEKVLIITHGTTTRCLAKIIEDISDEDIDSFNIPNSVPCVYEYDLEKKCLIGGIKYLANMEYVKKESEKVAAIGKSTSKKS